MQGSYWSSKSFPKENMRSRDILAVALAGLLLLGLTLPEAQSQVQSAEASLRSAYSKCCLFAVP